MTEFSVCKVTHVPTGKFFLSMPTNVESTRNAWRTKLKNNSQHLPFPVRALLAGEPARPEDWTFEIIGTLSYQTFGDARDAFDALLLKQVETVGWDMVLNVDVFMVDGEGRRVRTPESAARRREANGNEAWGKF